MPEAPEIKVLCDQLERFVSWNIEICAAPTTDGVERKVERVFMRGKRIILELTNRMWIVFQLALEGYLSHSCADSPESVLTMIRLWHDDPECSTKIETASLFFCEPPSLDGHHKASYFVHTSRAAFDAHIGRIAPGFLEHDTAHRITEEVFEQRFMARSLGSRNRNRSIAAVLLDQEAICSGLGTYLVSDILYDCRMSPLAPCRAVREAGPECLARLYASCHRIVHDAYTCNGNSMYSYRDLYGRSGTFKPQLSAHSRTKRSTTIAGRRIYHIPTYQPIPTPIVMAPKPLASYFELKKKDQTL